MGKTTLLKQLDGIYVNADTPSRMLAYIASTVNLRPSRAISATIEMLRPRLRGGVLLIDNAHVLSKSGIYAILRLSTTFVAAANHKVDLLYRDIVKLKRFSFSESREIIQSMADKTGLKLDDEIINTIARRSNGNPGAMRTLVNDARIAEKLGDNVLEYLDSVPLPRTRRFKTQYLLLALASLFLALRYIFYRYNLYDMGYTVAIVAYLIYAGFRFRRFRGG